MRISRTLAAVAALVFATALPVVLQAQGGGAQQAKTLDRANMDTTCAACEDFYTFANGGWLARTQIPAAYSSYGPFHQLNERNEKSVRDLVERAAADVRAGRARAGSNVEKIGAFFDACMDSTAIETLGVRPIEGSLRLIAAITSRQSLTQAIADLEASDGLAPYGISASPDLRNSERIIAGAGQGGLILPDRDLYLKDDAQSKQIRDAYVAHVQRMFELLGDSPAQAATNAATVLRMETKFAEASMDRVTQRNPAAIYNLMTVAQFDSMVPNLAIRSYLAAAKAPPVTDINVAQVNFFKAMNGFVADLPVEDWKTLLRWRLVKERAAYLPKRFVDENFAFNRILSGAKEQHPRWKRCTQATDAALGEALGAEYVAVALPPEAKERARTMVDNMVAVLRGHIGGLEWMTPATKEQALVKLDAFARKIGYPDRWRDYSSLQPRRGEFLENARRTADFASAYNWAKVGKPVDKAEWFMTPPTVNAYYNPLWNEIVFPAGILQPPFFDPTADDAVNYGAMGAIIGHEITHGFDDQGRQFDAKGNLRDWWTPQDAERYKAEAEKVVAQFSEYTVVDSATKVNGRLTLGENIADLGGLKIAYLAMQRAMETKGRPPAIDGFTPEQRFFLGWAQAWRTLARDEAMRQIVLTDPHSPAKWRVNGPLSNMPEFHAAWRCKQGDRMVRPEALRARIW